MKNNYLERLLPNMLIGYTAIGFGLTGWYHDWKTMIVVASLSIVGVIIYNTVWSYRGHL